MDGANRALCVVRSLPEVLEHAFRAAARESAFLRSDDADFFAVMRDRALFHFDLMLRASSVLGDAEWARTELARWVRDFAKSMLHRRLAALPLHRVHLAQERGLDLLAIGTDETCYAIRFVAFEDRNERLRLARRIGVLSSHLDGLIIASLDEGTLQYYRFAFSTIGASPLAPEKKSLSKERQRLR